jgi:hypothetical protein
MPTGAILNNDFDRMDANASRLESIGQNVVAKLARYMSTNQDLTGPGLGGTAGTASLASAEKIQRAGVNVHAHYGRMVDAIRSSTAGFRAQQEQATAALSNVAT